jgi:hypothetical protein
MSEKHDKAVMATKIIHGLCSMMLEHEFEPADLIAALCGETGHALAAVADQEDTLDQILAGMKALAIKVRAKRLAAEEKQDGTQTG